MVTNYWCYNREEYNTNIDEIDDSKEKGKVKPNDTPKTKRKKPSNLETLRSASLSQQDSLMTFWTPSSRHGKTV